MITDYYLIALILGSLLVSAAQRLLCVYFWGGAFSKTGFSGDASVHFGMIRHLKSEGKKAFIPNYLIAPEPYSYPIFFHYLSSFLPLSFVRNHEWVPNLIISVAGFSLFIAIVVFFFQFGASEIVVISIFYFMSPVQWVFHGPNIAYLGLSERYLARIWSSLYYLCLFAHEYTNNYHVLLLASVFGAFALISGKFARQAILFVTPILALFVGFEHVLGMVGAFALAAIFGGSRFRRGMYHSALQWRIYRSHTKASPHVLPSLSRFFNWRFNKHRSLLHNVVKNLVEYSPSREFFICPELLLLPMLMFLTSAPDMSTMISFVAAPAFIYLIVCTERFNHLGEAYRYIEYIMTYLFPCLLLFASRAFAEHYQIEHTLVIFIIALIYLPVIVLFIRVFASSYDHSASTDYLSAFMKKANIPEDAVVFPVSMRLGADIVARLENSKSFWWQPGIISESIYDDYIEEYPFLKKDWKALAKRHQVTHIICSKDALAQLTTWCYDFSGQEKIAEDDEYIAYKVRL